MTKKLIRIVVVLFLVSVAVMLLIRILAAVFLCLSLMVGIRGGYCA